MRPEDNQLQPQQPRGAVTPPSRDYQAHHDAAAAITRNQIDSIYSDQAAVEAQHRADTSVADTSSNSPYGQTQHNQHTVDQNQWQRYHSSWQDYYQKYYERYYVGAVQQVHSAYQEHVATIAQQPASAQEKILEATEEPLSSKEATEELRSKLRGRIQDRAKKVRKSRHFIPGIAAVAVALIFGFIQFNTVIIGYAKAYVSPGDVEPQNIIVDPNQSLEVDPAPRLIIPKINVDIAVNYDAKTDHDSQMAAMKDGVAYFGINGANSRPGQLGNIPIAGHSSNDFTDSGSAKFVFARLEQLTQGDTFYLNYEGTRYTYTVTGTSVVKPTQINALQIGDDKPYATLITCTPLGTAQDRFLVFAEQVSPSPSTAKTAPSSSGSSSNAQMAGKSPTLFERAFGAN